MKLTKQQEEFIKANKLILCDIFNERIDELKDEMVIASPDDMLNKAMFIQEFKGFLRNLKIIGDIENKGQNKQNYV